MGFRSVSLGTIRFRGGFENEVSAGIESGLDFGVIGLMTGEFDQVAMG
jgi:hypothetical protein